MWKQLEFKYIENTICFIIPILVLLVLIMASRKKGRILNSLNLQFKYRYKILSFILTLIGIGLIVFSLLGPQIFKGYQEVKKEGLDIYILLDTSKSMLVEDIKPSRIERSKIIVDKILNSLEGDRVGFIPFSSDAYIQLPLTDDYELAQMFLQVIDTDLIAGGGTNISAAINLALNSFQRSAQGEKVILIISDGEEHDSGSLELAETIRNENIKIFTIGVGTGKGGLIPVFNSQGKIEGYKKDYAGDYVNSRLQPEILRQLAETGGGSYFQATLNGQEVAQILANISSLEGRQYKTEKIRKFTQLYQYFLGNGIILFIIGYFLFERREKDEE